MSLILSYGFEKPIIKIARLAGQFAKPRSFKNEKKNNISLDPFDFAASWRAEYQPAMEEIRKGRRSFTILDILHMENLKKIAPKLKVYFPYKIFSIVTLK